MHWRARYFAIIGSLLPLILPKLSGDTPLPPPEVVRVASRNFNVGAESDPQTNETTVYRQNRGPEGGIARGETLWKFPRWFRVFQVSNDDNTIVAETDYLNLLPPDVARDDYVLLTFIVHGKVIREITVRQLLGSRSHSFQFFVGSGSLRHRRQWIRLRRHCRRFFYFRCTYRQMHFPGKQSDRFASNALTLGSRDLAVAANS